MAAVKTWVLWFLLLIQLNVSLVLSDVELTFPLERKMANPDVRTSGRMLPPCGLPKGSSRTTLLAGSKLNVTWNMGTLHKGGYKIELLDPSEKVLMDLTPVSPDGEFITHYPLQNYEVKLPQDLTCRDCTLRLVHRAAESGTDNRLFSCADIDIITKPQYRETCSGHGKDIAGRCRCNALYYGPRCQYKDECTEDKHCGRHGRCLFISPDNQPRRQCFCEMGWFGPSCNKQSSVKKFPAINFSDYRKRELSPQFTLYWRHLRNVQQLEAVLVVHSTAYAALGWRPSTRKQSANNAKPTTESPSVTTKASRKIPPLDAIFPKAKLIPINTESLVDPFLLQGSISGSGNVRTKRKPIYYGEYEDTERGQRETVKLTDPDVSREIIMDDIPAFPGPRVTSSSEKSNSSSTVLDNGWVPVLRSDSFQTNESMKPADAPGLRPGKVETLVNKPVLEQLKEQSDPLKTENQQRIQQCNPYGEMHPMDCMDMVIGMARGNLSRIGDYFSRDRSTPKRDTFYGGREDLTAALGYEANGVTYILFRRKLNTSDVADHVIEDQPMDVAWARGFDPSLVQTTDPSSLDFYKPDELKYHGSGSVQRGLVSINFLEKDPERINATQQASTKNLTDFSGKTFCGSDWKFPADCDPAGSDCLYYAKWEYLWRTDDVKFTLRTNYTNKWIAVGFSASAGMPATDIILGWVEFNGRVYASDMWAVGYTSPLMDESQDLRNVTGIIEDGKTILSFIRQRITSDTKQDSHFTDDSCLYMKFPVYGGSYHPTNKRISKHLNTPIVTSDPVCIRSCGVQDDPDSSKSSQKSAGSIPTAATKAVYNLELKLAGLAKDFRVPEPDSLEFNELGDRLGRSVSSLLTIVPGFEKASVTRFTGGEKELIAHITILLDEEDSKTDSRVKKVLQNAVTTGSVGRVPVDPNYLVIQHPATASIDPNPQEKSSSFDWSSLKLSPTVLWSIVGCLVGLVVLSVVQASYMVHKATTKRSKRQKDPIGRRHVSAVNYGYEPFNPDDRKQQRSPSGHLERPGRTSGSRNFPTSVHFKPDFYFMPSQRHFPEDTEWI